MRTDHSYGMGYTSAPTGEKLTACGNHTLGFALRALTVLSAATSQPLFLVMIINHDQVLIVDITWLPGGMRT